MAYTPRLEPLHEVHNTVTALTNHPLDLIFLANNIAGLEVTLLERINCHMRDI
jgi:hypothetical protein